MPRLPTAQNLGPAPLMQPIGAAGIARNTAAAAGLAAAAKGVASLANAFAEEDKFEAERRFAEFAYQEEQNYSNSLKTAQPGASGFRDSVVGGYQERAKAFLKNVPDHLKPDYDRKLLETEVRLSRNSDTFETKERERFAVENVDHAHSNLSLMVQADPTKFAEAAQSSKTLLDTVPTDNITRETLRKKYGNVISKSVIEGMLKNGASEDEVRKFIGGMEKPKHSYDPSSTQGKIASNVSNPAYALAVAERESSFKHDAKASKTIRGLFQIDEPTREQFGIAENASPEEQAAGFDRMTAARAGELSKVLGRAPTLKETYLAHHFGVRGATNLLTADPEASTKDWVFDTFDRKTARLVWDQNPHIRNAKTVGNLVNSIGSDIEKRVAKYGGDANAAYDAAPLTAGNNLELSSFAEKRIAHWNEERQKQTRARLLDEERAIRLQERQAQVASDAEEINIIRQMADPKMRDQVTAQAIAGNDKLNRSAIERLMSMVDRIDRTDNTYGPEFYNLFQRVHLPEGDPNKINGLDQLVPHVTAGGGLKLSGYNELVRQIQGKATPEGEAESKMLSQFLKNAHEQLSGSNTMLGIKDPKGEEINLRFMAQTLPLYYKMRGQGKTPSQLLDPESPDYLGKSIATMKRSQNEMVRDMIGGIGREADTSTPQGLVSAVQSGKLTREEGEKIAIERGWIRPPAPTVAPPISLR